MLLDTIKQDIGDSLKKGEHVRVETLRFLLAAVRNMAIAKYGSQGEAGVTDADVLDVIKKQVKTHKESIDAFTNAGRKELAEKEQAELTILSTFLPKEISDEELKAMIAPVVAQSDASTMPAGRQDFGLLMKSAMASVGGKADGGRVSAMIKEMLQERQ